MERWRVAYLDLDPQVIAGTGRRTTAMAETWVEWAGVSAGTLRDIADEARDPGVSAAVEGYLSRLNPALHGLAQRVDTLGFTAVSASTEIAASGAAAVGLPHRHGAREIAADPMLRRPINS